MTAVQGYNRAIGVADRLGDHATRDILAGILADEDAHVNEIEERLDQIRQMGIQNFLANQTGA